MTDPYAVLGVDRSATTEQIKAAYRKKAKECHPDLHPDDPNAQAKMNEVNQAYDMLTNPAKYQNQAGSADGSSYGGYSGYGGYGGFYGNPFGGRYSSYNQDGQEDPNNPYKRYNRRVVFRFPSIWKIILAITIIRFIFRFFYMCALSGGGPYY